MSCAPVGLGDKTQRDCCRFATCCSCLRVRIGAKCSEASLEFGDNREPHRAQTCSPDRIG